MSESNRQQQQGNEIDAGRADVRESSGGAQQAHLLSLHRTLGNAAIGRAIQMKSRQIGSEGLEAAVKDFVGPETLAVVAPTPAAGSDVSMPDSGGQALPPILQQQMQGPAGTELHDVRIHQGGSVDSALASQNALAATQGTNVYLSADVDLASDSGQDTLIHELRHVGQQKRGETADLDGLGGDPHKRAELERDADRH